MLELINYIKENKNWKEQLAAKPYCLNIREDGNLVLFKYGPDSDFNFEICKEARGIILEKDTWKVVRIAFDKFFNLGEKFAAKLDWSNVSASMKMDGTLVSLYWYNNKWNVATNGVIYAENAKCNSASFKNFKELFDFAAKSLDYSKLNKNNTYTFELCSSFNVIVCRYNETKIYHILTRNNQTLEEIEEDIGIEKPQIFNFNTLAEYKELVNNFEKNTEGIVLKDKNNNRIKLKTKLYFELHKKVNNHQISTEMALDLIRKNEADEFLSYFSEYRTFFDSVENKLNICYSILSEINSYTQMYRNSFGDNRKAFAAEIKSSPFSALFFLSWDNKLTLSYVKEMNIKKFMNAFKSVFAED